MPGVRDQLVAFMITVIVGMTLGILFDIYRALRGVTKPRKWLTAFGDLVFWAVAAAITFWILLFVTRGEVRFYVFLGFLLGFTFYRATIGRSVTRTLVALFREVEEAIWSIGGIPEVLYRARRRLAGYLARLTGGFRGRRR